MHASHVTESLFYYQTRADTGPAGGRTPILILWLGIDMLVTAQLRSEIREAVESNEQCPETWLVYPAHLDNEVAALLEGEVRDRFANEVGFTYRLIAIDGHGRWAQTEMIGAETDRIVESEIPDLAPDLWRHGLRQIFRETDALFSSGPGFHFGKPSGAHTTHFLRASETATHALHASFIAACMLTEVEEIPLRMLSDTAGIHPILFHLRTLLQRLRSAQTIPIDSFGGYESFDTWVSLISTDDFLVISSSTSGALAAKITERLGDTTPPMVTLYYLSGRTPVPDRVLCDLTLRGVDSFETSGVLGCYYRSLPESLGSRDDCTLCRQRVPLLQLEGDSFLPRPDGLELRMITVRVFDRGPIDPKHRGDRRQGAFFSDFYGLDVVHMHAGDGAPARDSRRQFRTHIGHLLEGSAELGAEFRRELLRVRDSLQASLEMPQIDAFVSTEDIDSTKFARWLAEHTFVGEVANPSPRVFSRPELSLSGDGLVETLSSIPSGSSVVGVSSVVSSGRAILDLSRSLRAMPGGSRIGYLAAIGHPPSQNSWKILLNSLRWAEADVRSDFQFGWVLERDPLEMAAETAWTAEAKLAAQVVRTEPEGSACTTAAQARIEQIEMRPIGSRRLFVDPAFDGVEHFELRPINRGFIAWDFDYSGRMRLDRRSDPSQAEVFAAVSHMLHRSRFTNADSSTGRLSSRLAHFVLDPANFDRYNDPQIQAAILRSAHPGELDYHNDQDGSRAMTEVVLHSLANLDSEAGAAAAEFVIGLLIGQNSEPGTGLILRNNDFREVRRRLEEITGDADRAIGPYLRGLIRLLLTGQGQRPESDIAPTVGAET